MPGILKNARFEQIWHRNAKVTTPALVITQSFLAAWQTQYKVSYKQFLMNNKNLCTRVGSSEGDPTKKSLTRQFFSRLIDP